MADFISHRHLGCSFFSRAAPRNVLVSRHCGGQTYGFGVAHVTGMNNIRVLQAKGGGVENGPPEDHYVSRIKSGETEPNIPCDSCKGRGWLLCDFCNGQKTNVQVRANRFYRRCPTCRAVGVLICPQCKVFKCVTFADGTDAGLEL
ncbi:unnamed protein product [Sphagnum jensenii]|uniref:Uncharacterized protein n=1 Tax=Sphagnum jensenii TaxID=128206 RepID=A0ABP1BB29_9BRYO